MGCEDGVGVTVGWGVRWGCILNLLDDRHDESCNQIIEADDNYESVQ